MRSQIGFPAINPNGADVLVQLICVAEPQQSNPPHGPITPVSGFAEVIRRTNNANGIRNPAPVTLVTKPEIGSNYDLMGNSYELPVVIGYRMALHGSTSKPDIFATGCISRNDCRVEGVEAFERKVDLIDKVAKLGSCFIYPKENIAGSENIAVREKIERLKERGVICIPIRKLDEVRFLWKSRVVFLIKIAALFAMFVVLLPGIRWLVTPPANPKLDGKDVSLGVIATSINAGPVSGAYYKAFCPLALELLWLEKIDGYKCTPGRGTGESIDRGLKNPKNLGFVQHDGFSQKRSDNAEIKNKLFMAVPSIACEGLWMVTRKDSDFVNYDQVFASARDIAFVLPPRESGSAGTFEYLRRHVADLKSVLAEHKDSLIEMLDTVKEISNRNKKVGFFVQYISPNDETIRLIEERDLNLIHLNTNKITDIRGEDGIDIYSLRDFVVKRSGIINRAVRTPRTSCVYVGLITGKKEAFLNQKEQSAQGDLIKALQKRREQLNPEKKSPLATITGGD